MPGHFLLILKLFSREAAVRAGIPLLCALREASKRAGRHKLTQQNAAHSSELLYSCLRALRRLKLGGAAQISGLTCRELITQCFDMIDDEQGPRVQCVIQMGQLSVLAAMVDVETDPQFLHELALKPFMAV